MHEVCQQLTSTAVMLAPKCMDSTVIHQACFWDTVPHHRSWMHSGCRQQPHLCVHVGPVHVHLAAVLVDDAADLIHTLLVHTWGRLGSWLTVGGWW